MRRYCSRLPRLSMRLLLLVLLMPAIQGCWFHSKKGAIQHLENYLLHMHPPRNPANGISHRDVESVRRNLPAAAKWVVDRIHGVQGVFDDCDTNHDGVIHMMEAYKARNCAESCWKQAALTTFLN